MTGWLPEAVESDAYEGIRRGDVDAFRLLAEPLQPTLRRLAGLYVDSETSAEAVVRHSWDVALHGLDMFRWRTPLATWVTGITVAFGRTHHGRAEAARLPQITHVPARELPGPENWSDLPWGPRWEQAGATLVRTLAALPIEQREVIHGRDMEQWPPRRVCDVFGLPDVAYRRLLTEARTQLHGALALLIGQTGPTEHRDAQLAAITGWLNRRLDSRPEPLDPHLVAVFRRWSATRHRGWRRFSHRLLRLEGALGRT